MVKKRNEAKEKDKERLFKILQKAVDAASFISSAIAQSHPIVIGLLLMGTCTAGKILAGTETDKNRHLHMQLTGLYNGAQSVAVAAATVPVVAGGLNLLGQALAMRVPAAK